MTNEPALLGASGSCLRNGSREAGHPLALVAKRHRRPLSAAFARSREKSL